MDTVWLVLLSLCLGLIVGIGFTLIGMLAAKRGRDNKEASRATVSTEVADVLEAIESFAVILDSSLNIIYANGVAQQSDLVGEGLLRHGALQEVAASVLSSGETVTLELRDEVASADRSNHEHPPIDHHLTDAAVENLWVQGTRLGSRFVFIVVEDRGEAWRLEAIRRDFIANVSHELKTPVSAVSLLAEAIQEAADDPKMVAHFAGRLFAESSRLANLTSDIIQLSAAQQGTPARYEFPVSLQSILDAVVAEHHNLAERRGIGLILATVDSVTVQGNQEALTVAFSNIVSNAINYSSDGSHVGIGVSSEENMVEISIADQGVGIPAEDVERIFERFYRVDTARSRSTGGTGLGLSIVKNIIQGHGGSVRVWSRPGAGSTFTVTLPLYRSVPEDDAVESASQPQHSSSGQSGHKENVKATVPHELSGREKSLAKKNAKKKLKKIR